jgi:hypothetical protein
VPLSIQAAASRALRHSAAAAVIHDVAGVDPRTAGASQRLDHAAIACGRLPNEQSIKIDVLGQRGDHPIRRWVVVALDARILATVLTHEQPRCSEAGFQGC